MVANRLAKALKDGQCVLMLQLPFVMKTDFHIPIRFRRVRAECDSIRLVSEAGRQDILP